MNELEIKQEVTKRWLTNPHSFHDSLFNTVLWQKQVDVLESLRDNKYTAVKSGHSVGKSYIASLAVLWYLNTHHPSKVITTAPTWTQVEDILWKEIGNSFKKMRHQIMGRKVDILKTELRASEEHFAIGISTDDRQRFQGFHSPNLLVIIDEAGGVEPDIWEAISGLHPTKILAIGNPLEAVGNFHDCFTSPLWNKITINCEDCVKWQRENTEIPGLVTQDWIEERKQEWGAKSPLFEARVLGEFPEETADTLVSRAWVERARKGLDADNKPLDEENEEDTARVVSCDVATKHGENETVIGYRYGHTIKEINGYYRIATTVTADKLALQYSLHKPQSLVVDSDGIGEGVSDVLQSRKIPVVEFHGGYGQKAMDDTRFRNLRSQFFYIVAKKFEKGLYNLKHLDDKSYELLKNQLCAIKVKPPDARARIQVETKEDMMSRQVKSPDYADCLVYGEYGFWMARYAEIKEVRWR